MPFPFNTLPYGLSARIRELSTPVETYALQTAAGNERTALKPIIILEKVSNVELDHDNADTLATFAPFVSKERKRYDDIPANVIYDVQESLFLKNVTEYITCNPLFNKLYLNNIFCLYIRAETLDIKLLQKLAQRMLPHYSGLLAPKFSGSLKLHIKNMNVLIPEIFSIFPHLGHLSYTKLYNGWTRELADAAPPKLSFNNAWYNDTFIDATTFNSDDIERLLEKKCDMNVYYKIPENMTFETAISKVAAMMGPKFYQLLKTDPDKGWRMPMFSVTLKENIVADNQDDDYANAGSQIAAFVLRKKVRFNINE
uniref:SERPIN domain-containing protein n=1 Tax=Panagrellus redivivus TaxID=6233 RepID=A0A7E4W385_PANRE